MFSGKKLLITGGTGSFGMAILDRLLSSPLSEIRIFSRDEKKQEAIRHKYSSEKLRFIVGDVRDFSATRKACTGVDFVFHAAALKQVPSCEFNPLEAVKTNIIGTENVLTAAIEMKVSKVICLSTDKAVYPVNAMGMSKALMEKIMTAQASVASCSDTVICGTRYGNVLASRGSVVPLFISQIKQGIPLTITSPNMTRFLMTLDDAVSLVMKAFETGKNGEIFVLKSSSCSIFDLAQAVKHVYGVPQFPEVQIGIRHGEKMFETLISSEEMVKCEMLNNHFIISPDFRDLNYRNFEVEGNHSIEHLCEYNSNNADKLTKSDIVQILRSQNIGATVNVK